MITAGILIVSVLLGTMLWRHYLYSPWTRDGRISADIVNLSSDVSGPVVEMKVKDNEHVRRGDVLFVVDPARYRIALENATALVTQRKGELELKQRSAQRRVLAGDQAESKEMLDVYSSNAMIAQSEYEEAQAQLALARLNLQRTTVRSPVDGYVTNLNIHLGDYAVAGKSVLALVDQQTFVVIGYFEETKIQNVKVGNPVRIQLLGQSHELRGHVYSIARAIYDRDNPNSPNLLQNVTPTFPWVRLAQRIPVRIHLDNPSMIPQLYSGMTATVILCHQTAPQQVEVKRSLLDPLIK